MLTIAAYRIADLLVQVLPARVADALGVALARLAFMADVPHRRALEANLARVLGATPPRTVRARAREAFANFAVSFADFLRLGHPGRERLAARIEVHGAEHLAEARTSGRGVIVLSAHLGNWELGAAYLAALGTPVHVVARPHPDRRVEDFFSRRRRAWGVSMLPGRPLWKGAAGVLRRREWVALMVDRDDTGTPPAHRGNVCAWAAALSRRTGALVLPAYIVRLPDRRYAAYFEKPLAPESVRALSHLELMRRWLPRNPSQWFAFEPVPGSVT